MSSASRLVWWAGRGWAGPEGKGCRDLLGMRWGRGLVRGRGQTWSGTPQ